jgi:tellurite resistance protein
MKIKKLSILLGLILGISFQAILAQANPTKQFYEGVNANWNNRSYTQILVLINNRLASNSSDVLALSLKAYYYVFAEKDLAQAHQAANAFLAVVNAGANQDLKNQAQKIAKIVTDIPVTDVNPLTQEQRNAMHAELDTFPLIDNCMVFWGKFTGQL